jgi:hypothetical protein
VARELRSGREVRIWCDGLAKPASAPFNTGPEAAFVAFFASAELSCFLQLGWPLPANVVDLFAEHRVSTNGTGASSAARNFSMSAKTSAAVLRRASLRGGSVPFPW